MALTQISTNGIKDATIATADIADDAVTSAKIADDAIDSEHIANGALDTAHIASGTGFQVGSSNIENDAVIASKIADDAIGSEHIEVLDANLQFEDDATIRLGTGNDLELWHNGTNSYVRNNTGNLLIGSGGFTAIYGGEDYGEYCAAFTDNGSVDLYYDGTKTFETVSGGAKVTGELEITSHLDMGDGDFIKLGDGDDLQIYHNGTASYFDEVGTGGVVFSTDSFTVRDITSNESMIVATGDAGVELYYNDSKKFETSSTGGIFRGTLWTAIDNTKIAFGTGDDLQIFHDGSNSYIDNSTGELQLRAAYLKIRAKDDGETIATFDDDAGIALYYDGSKKLETTSSGVTIPTSSSAHGLRISSTGDTYNEIRFDSNRSNANTHIGRIINYWNGTAVSYISMDTGSDTTNKDDGIIRFWTSSGGGNYERMRILNGGGITFNGDTAAANAIDDYEEGTWTPTITTASGTITVGNVYHAEYTKIGRMVYITARITISAVSSPSGWLKIHTLPFTADSFAGLSLTTTGMGDTDDKIPQGLVEYNTTYCMMRTFRDGAESDNISGFFQNGTAVIMSACYNVA